MTKVELFELIRLDVLKHGLSIRAAARKHGTHRRMVRQALASSVPPERKTPERVPDVLTHKYRQIIDGWLGADRTAPKKQRHTARRVFQRLRDEEEFAGAESTVRRYVGQRRRELGLKTEGFVPLSHLAGKEAEVDWGEAVVEFPWGRETVHLFLLRACYSGREFVMAFPRETQQAFLEGHVAAFRYFGGVFEKVRLDNLTSAVKKVLRGRRRIETDRLIAMRSHYLFATEFCIPGKEGAHEKGGVEGAVGRLRRSHFVPVPKVESYAELNRKLREWCAEDDMRVIEGRRVRIIDDWERERAQLRPLPEADFDTAEAGTVGVNNHGLVRVRTNRYSVPIRLKGTRVEYRLHAKEIELVHGGKVVARHPRIQARHQIRVELDHYLELLWHKPGAFVRSLALRQARERGEWPQVYDRLATGLDERFEEPEATRQMLAVLLLHRDYPADEVTVAVETALERGCVDAGAIAVVLRQLVEDDAVPSHLTGLGELHRFDSKPGNLNVYDSLLTRPSTMAVH